MWQKNTKISLAPKIVSIILYFCSHIFIELINF